MGRPAWPAACEVRWNLAGWLRLFFCISLLTFSGCHRAQRGSIGDRAREVFALAKDIEAALIKDSDAERSFQELPVAYHRELRPLLQGEWARGCDDKCMGSIFSAADYVCFFSYGQLDNPELPDIMRTAFDQLKAHSLSSQKQAENVRKCFIKFRRFDEAREFSVAQHLADEEIPSLNIPGSLPPSRRVIEYAPDGRSLSVVQANPLGKTAVVMSVRPTCVASMAAIEEIESNVAFRKALLPKLTIISSPSGRIEAAAFAAWNKKHPRFQLTQAFGAEDWPEISDWENYPTFYFIANGKVVARKFGWGPKALDGIKADFLELETSIIE